VNTISAQLQKLKIIDVPEVTKNEDVLMKKSEEDT
jgi:hypothetical protein